VVIGLVMGATGAGTGEAQGVSNEIECLLRTFAKSLLVLVVLFRFLTKYRLNIFDLVTNASQILLISFCQWHFR